MAHANTRPRQPHKAAVRLCRVLLHIHRHGPVTSEAVQRSVGYSITQTRETIKELRIRGAVRITELSVRPWEYVGTEQGA